MTSVVVPVPTHRRRVAQLRVMARFGGCGLITSGAFHQEAPPTTVQERDVDAPLVLR